MAAPKDDLGDVPAAYEFGNTLAIQRHDLSFQISRKPQIGFENLGIFLARRQLALDVDNK